MLKVLGKKSVREKKKERKKQEIVFKDRLKKKHLNLVEKARMSADLVARGQGSFGVKPA